MRRGPDIASLIQEVITVPGWTSGNALVFIIGGTGQRTARSYENNAQRAPLLHVEWTLP